MSGLRRMLLRLCRFVSLVGCGLLSLASEASGQGVEARPIAGRVADHAVEVSAPGSAVAFSPDGRWLAVGGIDQEVHIRSLDDRSLVRSLAGHEGPCTFARFSSDGTELLTIGRHVIVWETKDWTIAREVRPRERGSLLAVAHELPLAASVPGSRDRRAVMIWDYATGEVVQELKIDGIPLSAAFDPTDFVLAVGLLAESKEEPLGVEIWDLKSQARQQTIDRAVGSVSALSYSPDGGRLAIGETWTASIRDMKTGRELQRLEGHSGVIEAVAFSPDGTRLAVGGAGPSQRSRQEWRSLSELKLWRVEDRRLLLSSVGVLGRTRNVQFSADGRQIGWLDQEAFHVTNPDDSRIDWMAPLSGER